MNLTPETSNILTALLSKWRNLFSLVLLCDASVLFGRTVQVIEMQLLDRKVICIVQKKLDVHRFIN